MKVTANAVTRNDAASKGGDAMQVERATSAGCYDDALPCVDVGEWIASEGYWTDAHTGVVYDGSDGGSGSLPRECYADDPEYRRRSALHPEVIPEITALRMLAQRIEAIHEHIRAREEQIECLRKQLLAAERARSERVEKIAAAHWLLPR